MRTLQPKQTSHLLGVRIDLNDELEYPSLFCEEVFFTLLCHLLPHKLCVQYNPKQTLHLLGARINSAPTKSPTYQNHFVAYNMRMRPYAYARAEMAPYIFDPRVKVWGIPHPSGDWFPF